MEKVGIFFIVEPGRLEYQAEILIKSLRKLGGVNRSVPVYAFQPRRSGNIGHKTRKLFEEYNVIFEKVNLNRKTFFYPIANKILAGAYFEKKYPQFKHYLFLDTDLLILNPIEEIISEGKIRVSPSMDADYMEILYGETPNVYWMLMFSLFDLKIEDFWTSHSLSDNKRIHSYFNSGVISYPCEVKLFSNLKPMFQRVFRRKEVTKIPYVMLYFTDQMLLACHLAQKKMKHLVEELPITWNYPICLTKEKLKSAKLIHFQDYFEKNDVSFLEEGVREIIEGAQVTVSKKPLWLRVKEIVYFQLFKLNLLLR